MKRLGRATAIALLALAPAVPPATAAVPQTSLNEISQEVMCPVCGTLLELAESPQAQREKAFVKRLVDAGRSKQQIKDALVAEYGDAVLALPKGSGFDLSAYLVPIVAFLIAAVALAIGIARWRRSTQASSGARPPQPDADEESTKRLDEDMARYDL